MVVQPKLPWSSPWKMIAVIPEVYFEPVFDNCRSVR